MSTMNAPLIPISTDAVSRFRRFTRFYTRFIGTLEEGILGSALSLAEARVLYELATQTDLSAKEIIATLGLDPGYLSRILGRFEKEGFLKRAVSRKDARRHTLRLTPKGMALFRELDHRSDQQARGVFETLPPAQRNSLVASMGRIEALLGAPNVDVKTFSLRSHRPGDMGMIVHREGALYAQEYGWDDRFEALAARVVADFIDHFDPARERCWIAERDGEHLGHIFLATPSRSGCFTRKICPRCSPSRSAIQQRSRAGSK